MNNHIKIYGKKRSNYILNPKDVEFVSELSQKFSKPLQFNTNGTLENPNNVVNLSVNSEDAGKLEKILDKISSLSFIQENIYQIFDGLDLKNSASIQQLYNQFNFEKMIQDPKILNSYEFQNNISPNNIKKFSNKSYIKPANNINGKISKKLGKSVFVFFFILQKMVAYIKEKRRKFDALIASSRTKDISNVNSQKLNQAIKEYKGFEYLMNKFLKLREKIFSIIQLENKNEVEEEIPIGQNIRVEYHFFKLILDGIIRYTFNQNPNISYNDFNEQYIQNQKINFYDDGIEVPNESGNLLFKFNFDNNTLLEINRTLPIAINSNKSIFSILYIKEMNANKLYTIISQRNKSYYIFQYVVTIKEINENKQYQITKSYKPKRFDLDVNKLNSYHFGTIQMVAYYK